MVSKNLDQQLEQFLDGMDKNTDWQLRKSTSLQLHYANPQARQARTNRLREERSTPFCLIWPNGETQHFSGAAEASEHFGCAWLHTPDRGVKIVKRRQFKNCIVYRLDEDVYPNEIAQAQKQVEDKINPKSKPRDVDAWVEKMKKWRKTEQGQQELVKRREAAQAMGKGNAKPIMTPDGKFSSSTEAAGYYGITKGSMAQRLRDHPDKYYRIK